MGTTSTGRPHRPHPMGKRPKDPDAYKAWKAAHPKQETLAERRERKRYEAGLRQAEHDARKAERAARVAS